MSKSPIPITDPIDEFDDIDLAMPTLHTPAQTCQEVHGMIGEQPMRCGAPAKTLVQPRGRTEGPYWLCPSHASHYLHNRDCEDVTPKGEASASIRRGHGQWDPEAGPAPGAREPEVLDAEPARPADEQAIAHAAQSLVARAQAFQITSPETYETAGRIIDELKRQKKAVQGFFAPMRERAHAAWKAITTKEGGLTDPIDEALVVIQARYSDYARTVREEAERERRRLEREAQEREQARLRAEAEAREKEAQAAREAAAKAASAEEAQVLAQQAEELQQTAEATRVEAATVPAPVLPLQTPIDLKKGPTVAQNWTWELLDKLALARAVIEGKVSSEAILENGPYLTKRAKADKGTATIPGVRFYDAGSVRASRSRR